MTADTPMWLDIMPPIQLARAVPVKVYVGCYERWMDDVCMGRDEDGGTWSLVEYPDEPDDGVRCNLEDLQGFGYALRYLSSRTGDEIADFGAVCEAAGGRESIMGMQLRFWQSRSDMSVVPDITDADRLALAEALATSHGGAR